MRIKPHFQVKTSRGTNQDGELTEGNRYQSVIQFSENSEAEVTQYECYQIWFLKIDSLGWACARRSIVCGFDSVPLLNEYEHLQPRT